MVICWGWDEARLDEVKSRVECLESNDESDGEFIRELREEVEQLMRGPKWKEKEVEGAESRGEGKTEEADLEERDERDGVD